MESTAGPTNTPTAADIDRYLLMHYMHRSGWLRAAVLGANDGILSVSSIAIGVASASTTAEPVVLAAVAGAVAGALSMAAGEYVSVSSQTDTEHADIAREARELKEDPEGELQVLALLFEQRGVSKATARKVAEEMSQHDALAAHVKEELGINTVTQARPIQAALASGAAFTAGGLLPVLVTLLAPTEWMRAALYGSSILFLIVLGIVSARTGGSSVGKGILRITLWGTLAMGLSALVGQQFGVSV